MAKFRFEDLEVWPMAIEIANELFDISDHLDKKRLRRCAERVRVTSLSISNNIAEGSGSNSKAEFARFLNIAKRAAFENANMAIVFEKRGLISAETMDDLLTDLEQECRMITGFMRSLKKG